MMAAAATSSNYQREQTNERHLRHNLSLLLPATYPTLPYFLSDLPNLLYHQ